MNPQPPEQPVRPSHSLADQHGAVPRAVTPRLLVVEERTLSNGVTPPHWTRPVAEPRAGIPRARRISRVESVAIQIFSGAIEFDVSGRNALATNQGVDQRRWPLLLNRAEVCEYLGASWSTLKNTLTVRPVDMGANMIRYNREQLKEWAARLPPRSKVPKQSNDVDGEAGALVWNTAETDITESRGEVALDRVRARAGGSKWRKTT